MESLKEVSRASLEQMHALDPAKHDFADKGLFEARKKLAVRLFNQNYLKQEVETTEEVEVDVLENVNNEIEEFQKRLASEGRVRKTEMLKDARKIYDIYLKFLILPIEIEHREKLESEKKNASGPWPFINHPIIQKLKDSELLTAEAGKHQTGWGNEQEEIKNWYRQEIRTSEALTEYFQKEAESKTLVTDLFKKVIFKNEMIVSYLETQYLHWPENQPIIKSMVLKSLKSLDSDGSFELAELTKNGKEDFDFFEEIFDGVMKENEYLDTIIANKAKNWDVDRIALTDRVILKVALSEMMNCPSIPMKVSINEAIEISKQYSTPKSKQFINGVLDVLSNELTSNGKVRKSGRGLIDNK
ncbi:MAG: transcription antitermination factor NusB [Cyclobacteriaceae bacterium]